MGNTQFSFENKTPQIALSRRREKQQDDIHYCSAAHEIKEASVGRAKLAIHAATPRK